MECLSLEWHIERDSAECQTVVCTWLLHYCWWIEAPSGSWSWTLCHSCQDQQICAWGFNQSTGLKRVQIKQDSAVATKGIISQSWITYQATPELQTLNKIPKTDHVPNPSRFTHSLLSVVSYMVISWQKRWWDQRKSSLGPRSGNQTETSRH